MSPIKSTRIAGGHHRIEHDGYVWDVTRHGASGKATRWRAEREQDGEIFAFVAHSLTEVKTMLKAGRTGTKKRSAREES